MEFFSGIYGLFVRNIQQTHKVIRSMPLGTHFPWFIHVQAGLRLSGSGQAMFRKNNPKPFAQSVIRETPSGSRPIKL